MTGHYMKNHKNLQKCNYNANVYNKDKIKTVWSRKKVIKKPQFKFKKK